jgi:V/A-type H+-transporting ATPase subunit E
MNGIEKITEHIEAEARAQVEQIEAETREKCDSIKKDYDAKAQEEYWKIFKAGTKSAELQVERLGNAAQLEAKKKVLAAKQDEVTAAFKLARDKLTQLPDDDYIDLLSKLTAQAASTGHEKIIMSVADRARCGKAVCIKANAILEQQGRDGELTLSENTAEISGGVIVSDGSIEVNCSFETLLSQKRQELQRQVADMLFDE